MAPSSTLAFSGARVIVISLVTVSCAVADFVESASLVAVIWTIDGEGKSLGAVYTPAELMVPLDTLPPGTSFTLHLTFMSVVFVTVAANVCEFPSKTEPLLGVTVTLMDCGGGGGGGAVTEPAPPPQPVIHIPIARAVRNGKRAATGMAGHAVYLDFTFPVFCGRGRMQGGMQAKGQRKE